MVQKIDSYLFEFLWFQRFKKIFPKNHYVFESLSYIGINLYFVFVVRWEGIVGVATTIVAAQLVFNKNFRVLLRKTI